MSDDKAVSLDLRAVYQPSEDVVAREIEGEIIIVPLVAGIAGDEEDLFTLNKTGKIIWQRLDGKANLEKVISDLQEEFDSGPGEIEHDVKGFVLELLSRKILVQD
jgi:hypothetical protein